MSSHKFNGPDFIARVDGKRLNAQHRRIRDLMLDGKWRTVGEIAALTSDPETSVSAQLRHLRKEEFGAYTVERRRRGDPGRGLSEFRVTPPVHTVGNQIVMGFFQHDNKGSM